MSLLRPPKYLRKLPTFIPIPHYLKSRKYSVLYVCTIHNWRSRDRWNCPHQSESKHWRKNIILLYLLHGPVNTNHDPYCTGSRSTFESKLLCIIIDSLQLLRYIQCVVSNLVNDIRVPTVSCGRAVKCFIRVLYHYKQGAIVISLFTQSSTAKGTTTLCDIGMRSSSSSLIEFP